MSNIGYAVFGSPKGLAVISNGLFKTLNLDKSLYLNNVHVVLEKGDQVLMIRRIPSDTGNLEKKDGLLIALYENALQHSENRAGGFVGSAICFKSQMPNADEIISGLVYLFSKMKENVDVDNRFKALDSSGWNIKLPDANKTFGLEEGKFSYTPITTTKTNIVVKLNSLKHEAASLLYNFTLNRSFHSVDYVYASSSKAVVDRIKSKGFTQVPFTEFFNYKKHLAYYKDQLVKETEKVAVLDRNAAELQRRIVDGTNELKSLENKIASKSDLFNDLLRRVREGEDKLSRLQNNIASTNSSLNVSSSKTRSNPINEDLREKYNSLHSVIKKASDVIEEFTPYRVDESQSFKNRDEFHKLNVNGYFKSLPKRRSKAIRIRTSLYGILLLLLITFIVLFVWKSYNFNQCIEKTIQKEQVINSINTEIEAKNKKSEERLKKLKNVEKGSATFNQKKFYELAEGLLKEHLEGKTNEKEKEFINDRAWEFFEFNYTDTQIVEKLNPNSEDTYFILFENKTIKDLSPYLSWNGKDQIDQLLLKYKSESNDIYQDLDEKVLLIDEQLLVHFQWLIDKENGNIEDLKKGEKIKLPFTEKK